MRKLKPDLQPMAGDAIVFELPILAIERFIALDALTSAKADSFEAALANRDLRDALLQPEGSPDHWDWTTVSAKGLQYKSQDEAAADIHTLTLTKRDIKALRDFVKTAVATLAASGDSKYFVMLDLYDRLQFVLGV